MSQTQTVFFSLQHTTYPLKKYDCYGTLTANNKLLNTRIFIYRSHPALSQHKFQKKNKNFVCRLTEWFLDCTKKGTHIAISLQSSISLHLSVLQTLKKSLQIVCFLFCCINFQHLKKRKQVARCKKCSKKYGFVC